MKLSGFCQNVVDGSYDSNKSGKHVSEDHVSVVEVGAEACVGAITFVVPKGEAKCAAGDRVDCVINTLFVWQGQLRAKGSVVVSKQAKQ